MSFTVPARLQRVHDGLAPWQRHVLLVIAFMIVATPLIAFRAWDDKPLSIYDEWQYSDRVHQVMEGNVWLSDGEPVSRWGEFARACRGTERLGVPEEGVPCSLPPGLPPTPNYAGPDPAPYFIATGFIAEGISDSGLVGNQLVAMRLVGILWAGLSMWCLWLLARAFGAPRAASAVVASTVILIPAFLQQYIHVTPHALDIPVGAFTALAALRYLQRRWPVWMLAVAAVTIVGVKGSNIVIAVVVGMTFAAVILWPEVERRDRIRAFIGGVVLTVTTVALFVAHSAAVTAAAVADYPPPGTFVRESIDWNYVIIDSIKFLSTWGEGPLAAPAAWIVLAMAGTAMAVWAGLVPGLPPHVRQFAPGYLIGAAVGAVLLDIMVFVTTEQQFGVHFRYGLAVFPVGLVFAAMLLRTRTALVIAMLALLLGAALPALLSLDTIAA